MKAALYAWVSTGEQNAQTQLRALRDDCLARGWDIYHEYVDEGIWGAAPVRPQLDLMMENAKYKWFKAVLVWKFDRLFRSVPHMLTTLDRFYCLDIDFVSVTEAIDTSSPMGKMVFTLLAAVGEFERDLIRERTRAGMNRAKAEGKRIGRPRSPVDVERAIDLWNGGKGLSYRKIADELGSSPTVVFEALSQAVLKRSETLLERGKGGLRGHSNR